MKKKETLSRIRVLADRYAEVTGEHVYAGVDARKLHYFSDGAVYGHNAAYQHMVNLCQKAGIDVAG